MDCSTQGFPVHHQFPELTQTHVHWVSDAIQPEILCHPLPLPPTIVPSIRVFSKESGLHIRWPKYLRFQLQHQSFQCIQGWFPLGWTGSISLQSKGLSRVSPTPQFKAPILQHSAFFITQLSHPYMITGKTTALTRWTFVGKVMSLLFNMLSRVVIAFLPRSKRLLISWLGLPSAVILEPSKIKSATVSPSICYEVMGPDAMILVICILSVKPNISLSSFTFIKGLFSSSFSAIRAVSSAYLRLLIFLPANLIPAVLHPAWNFM